VASATRQHNDKEGDETITVAIARQGEERRTKTTRQIETTRHENLDDDTNPNVNANPHSYVQEHDSGTQQHNSEPKRRHENPKSNTTIILNSH